MSKEKIIQKITAFAVAGKLTGLVIDVPFHEVTLRMQNIRVDLRGLMRFDQYRSWPNRPDREGWECTGENYTLDEHVEEYLDSVLNKIYELVKRDRNLF